MLNRILKTAIAFNRLVLMSFSTQPQKIKVYLIGDSTMANKQVKAYPETGWGMPFTCFFDQTVTVDNRAQNGRSTKTFIEENRWQPVVDDLKEGDYVLVQFGHNDEVKTKKSYTTENEFKANLIKYVSESRSKKAIPVLITPVARRSFDAAGKIVGTHEVYSGIVRTVAKEQNDASQPKGKDRVLAADPHSIIWARFYDIKTNQPFFTGRDGIIKKTVAEIEIERRTGYAWYGTWPASLISKKYPKWLKSLGG